MAITPDESYTNYLSHSWETVSAGDGEADCWCTECGCENLGNPYEFEWLEYPACDRKDD